jgi:hypothetical protein
MFDRKKDSLVLPSPPQEPTYRSTGEQPWPQSRTAALRLERPVASQGLGSLRPSAELGRGPASLHGPLAIAARSRHTAPAIAFLDPGVDRLAPQPPAADLRSQTSLAPAGLADRKLPLRLGKVQTEIYVQNSFAVSQTHTKRPDPAAVHLKTKDPPSGLHRENTSFVKKAKASQPEPMPRRSPLKGSRQGSPSRKAAESPGHTGRVPELASADSRAGGCNTAGGERSAAEWVIRDDSPPGRSPADRAAAGRQRSGLSSPTQSLRREFAAGANPKLTDRSERLFSDDMQAQVGHRSEVPSLLAKKSTAQKVDSRERTSQKDNSDCCLSPLMSAKASSTTTVLKKTSQGFSKDAKNRKIGVKPPKVTSPVVQPFSNSQVKQTRISLRTNGATGNTSVGVKVSY